MIKRRLLAVGLVATMMVSICGCGAKDSKKDEAKSEETSIAEEVTTEDTISEGFDYNEGAIKAVRVKVDMQTAGVVRIFIDQYHTFDSLY